MEERRKERRKEGSDGYTTRTEEGEKEERRERRKEGSELKTIERGDGIHGCILHKAMENERNTRRHCCWGGGKSSLAFLLSFFPAKEEGKKSL
jgi:hypothetical protein